MFQSNWASAKEEPALEKEQLEKYETKEQASTGPIKHVHISIPIQFWLEAGSNFSDRRVLAISMSGSPWGDMLEINTALT